MLHKNGGKKARDILHATKTYVFGLQFTLEVFLVET